MLSTINTPDETTPTSRDEMPDLTPGPGQVLIEVEAFSLNRGELALLAARQHGWQPGQDIAGRVAASAAPGLDVGTRVVGLVAGGGWSRRKTLAIRGRPRKNACTDKARRGNSPSSAT